MSVGQLGRAAPEHHGNPGVGHLIGARGEAEDFCREQCSQADDEGADHPMETEEIQGVRDPGLGKEDVFQRFYVGVR